MISRGHSACVLESYKDAGEHRLEAPSDRPEAVLSVGGNDEDDMDDMTTRTRMQEEQEE